MNLKIIKSFWLGMGIPEPQTEFRFFPKRKWRFDFAWDQLQETLRDKTGKIVATRIVSRPNLAIEVQGGIWTRGRHTRGAALKLEHEKLNMAAILGWRILYCEPSEILTVKFAKTIRQALNKF